MPGAKLERASVSAKIRCCWLRSGQPLTAAARRTVPVALSMNFGEMESVQAKTVSGG